MEAMKALAAIRPAVWARGSISMNQPVTKAAGAKPYR